MKRYLLKARELDNTQTFFSAAILCKLFPIESLTQYQVSNLVKMCKGFRSAIVHSKEKKELDKSRNLRSNILPDITSVEAGLKTLSHSVNILLANPQFLQVENWIGIF
ncbi:MAG: hypothetical protein IPK08_18705 [Bacteroidetes bacterium]|nr:hypothetical protein [Bacteroidota bacterium]